MKRTDAILVYNPQIDIKRKKTAGWPEISFTPLFLGYVLPYLITSQAQTVANHKNTAKCHGAGGQHRVEQAERRSWDQDYVVEKSPEQVLLNRS